MRRIFAMLPRIAQSESIVLLEGETGTGKTLLAEAIHEQSARNAGPFLVLDCGAIPPTLIESELFGHDKGAFTGAQRTRPGIFEQAQGGTVFLDEIGELPLDMQPKLLRVLEERHIRRVGGEATIKLDIRVLAATNRDLREMVNRGTFRSDLFYRLNVVRLRVPPLRERREDIPLLANQFYAHLTDGSALSAPALERFLQRDWPGNVRELRSAIERLVVVGEPLPEDAEDDLAAPSGRRTEGPTFQAAAGGVPPPGWEAFDPALPYRVVKERAVTTWERWYLTELLELNGGAVRPSARAAQMDRSYLRTLLRRHGVALAHDEL